MSTPKRWQYIVRRNDNTFTVFRDVEEDPPTRLVLDDGQSTAHRIRRSTATATAWFREVAS